MIDLFSGFTFLDMPTLVIMSVVLYVSLTLVICYAYRYRKTYPGFGAFTLGQTFLSAGLLVVHFRVLGTNLALTLGNLLLLLHPACWYYGLTLYGGIDRPRRRAGLNLGLVLLAEAMLAYLIFVDFDTCKRVLVFSACSSILYLRVALEPYCIRRWRTYSMQALFSVATGVIGVFYAFRLVLTWNLVDCTVGGADPITKFMLLSSMLLFPLLTYSLLSMTSARVEDELREATSALRRQAETDALTGLSNRRHFLAQTEAALTLATSGREPVSLLMFDLDYFKDINDTHGHQAGDTVLREVARCLQKVVRERDTVGRLGGEEFGILLPGLDSPAATRVAHRLRQAVAALRPGGLRVTASLGVGTGADGVDALLARADECLYAAKRAGRNRVGCRDAATCRVVTEPDTPA